MKYSSSNDRYLRTYLLSRSEPETAEWLADRLHQVRMCSPELNGEKLGQGDSQQLDILLGADDNFREHLRSMLRLGEVEWPSRTVVNNGVLKDRLENASLGEWAEEMNIPYLESW